jgi:hypothetical protein
LKQLEVENLNVQGPQTSPHTPSGKTDLKTVKLQNSNSNPHLQDLSLRQPNSGRYNPNMTPEEAEKLRKNLLVQPNKDIHKRNSSVFNQLKGLPVPGVLTASYHPENEENERIAGIEGNPANSFIMEEFETFQEPENDPKSNEDPMKTNQIFNQDDMKYNSSGKATFREDQQNLKKSIPYTGDLTEQIREFEANESQNESDLQSEVLQEVVNDGKIDVHG